MATSFRCSLYMQADGDLPVGDFRPFRTAEEMTQFTGLTVDAWNARVKPVKVRRAEATKRRAAPLVLSTRYE